MNEEDGPDDVTNDDDPDDVTNDDGPDDVTNDDDPDDVINENVLCATFTFSTRLKHLCRERLWRTAF